MANNLTVCTDTAPLVPNKRLHYNFGMVLGVNDFQQEQDNLAWKQRISNLLLHGSGTVCGLQVSAQAIADGSDVEIQVAEGYAISPHGRWIWVDQRQCALLGKWLKAVSTPSPPLSPPPGPGRNKIYVKLCYDECDVDQVPVAGQACLSDGYTRKPSRTLESFRLEFAWSAPPQPAEELHRAFGALLDRIQIVPGATLPPASPPTSPPLGDDSALLLQLVRNLGKIASPPALSPPAAGPIRLAEATACDTIRAALALWATEVCPRLAPAAADDDCILLACVEFSVDSTGKFVFSVDANGDLQDGSVNVDNCMRPILVSDRLKQELFCVAGQQGPPGATGPGIESVTLITPAPTTPSASLTGAAPNRTLVLGIPAGPPGATGPGIGSVSLITPAPTTPSASLTGAAPNRTLVLGIPAGPTGPGIDSVTLHTPTTGTASATLTGTSPNRLLELTIPIPASPTGPAPEQFNQIMHASWHLDEVFDVTKFVQRIAEVGLVVAFKRPVRIDTLHDRSVLVLIARPSEIKTLLVTTQCSCALPIQIRPVSLKEIEPITVKWLIGASSANPVDDTFDLITKFDVLGSGEEFTDAVLLDLPDGLKNSDNLGSFFQGPPAISRLTLTVLLRGEWIMNEEQLKLAGFNKERQRLVRQELDQSDDRPNSPLLRDILASNAIDIAENARIELEAADAASGRKRWRVADQNGEVYVIRAENETVSVSRLRALDGNHIWPGVPERPSGNSTAGGDWISTIHIDTKQG